MPFKNIALLSAIFKEVGHFEKSSTFERFNLSATALKTVLGLFWASGILPQIIVGKHGSLWLPQTLLKALSCKEKATPYLKWTQSGKLF